MGWTTVPQDEYGGPPSYFELAISTTSEVICPRANASCVPSGDHAELKMCPDLKLVICLAGPPVTGSRNRFDTE